MPLFRIPIATGEFYHVYNRGIAGAPTFRYVRNYEQMMLDIEYYRFHIPPMSLSRFKELSTERRNIILSSLQNSNKLVAIVSFALMPNHFHFLLKQLEDGGISKFISQITNSYTRYFNTLNERVGPVFQGVFKFVHVETDEQLVHLSRYIHLNPVVSNVISQKDLFIYPWTSLPHYFNPNGRLDLVWQKPVLEHFKDIESYKEFILDRAGYGRELEMVKHLALEK